MPACPRAAAPGRARRLLRPFGSSKPRARPAAERGALHAHSPRPVLFPKPEPKLFPNTYAFESQPMVKPTGFREYDARWLFEKEINLMGAQAVGFGLTRLLKELGAAPEIVVGHDFRSYSASIKLALTAGLMAGGAHVRDIGLALTPMAYFAQFALDTPAVAMVTASHNDNGWTGVKMGAARPVTFGPRRWRACATLSFPAHTARRRGVVMNSSPTSRPATSPT